MTIIEKINEVCPDGFDSYEFVNEVIGWPEVPEGYSDDEEVDMEPLDTENFYVKELEDNYMIVVSGGDWQNPLEVKIELRDRCLVATEVKVPEDWNFDDTINL